MTKRELIEKLENSELPDDIPVVICVGETWNVVEIVDIQDDESQLILVEDR